eukprot:1208751-Pleurochrysis_carterae.AAC.6
MAKFSAASRMRRGSPEACKAPPERGALRVCFCTSLGQERSHNRRPGLIIGRKPLDEFLALLQLVLEL